MDRMVRDTLIKRPATEVVRVGYREHRCVYCGEVARIIQPISVLSSLDIRFSYGAVGNEEAHQEVGHYCDCEGAQAEVVLKAKIVEIHAKRDVEVHELEDAFHSKYRDGNEVAREKIKATVLRRFTKDLESAVQGQFWKSDLERLIEK